jgi:hypothetical protein
MEALASSEFRKTFARLREPTVVQVNGHTLGTWTPGESGPAPVVAPSISAGPDDDADRGRAAARILALEEEVTHLKGLLSIRSGGLPPAFRSIEGLDHSRNNTPFTPRPKR